MARVNLEESLYSQSRVRRLAKQIGYTEHTVIGLLAFLWHDSQDFGQVVAHADDICEWARLDDLQSAEDAQSKIRTTNEVFVAALVRAGFISHADGNLYRIHGNEEQLEQRRKWEERAKKAADARWHKHDKKPQQQQPVQAALPMDSVAPCLSNAQASANAMPFNTIQDKTTKKKTCSPTPPKFDFEQLYRKYPRKRGKAAALKFFTKKIQTSEDFEQLSHAIDRFAEDCRKKGTEERYIPYFSSFIGERETWRDFIPQLDTPSTAPARPRYDVRIDPITGETNVVELSANTS